MELVICPECGEMIDLDTIEPMDPETVIGCGQKEGEFVSCNECGNKYDSVICNALRKDGGWTPTKAKDYRNRPKGL